VPKEAPLLFTRLKSFDLICWIGTPKSESSKAGMIALVIIAVKLSRRWDVDVAVAGRGSRLDATLEIALICEFRDEVKVTKQGRRSELVR